MDQSIRAEDEAARFYGTAAEQSKSLLADVARALAQVARRRDGRRARLEALREKAGQALSITGD